MHLLATWAAWLFAEGGTHARIHPPRRERPRRSRTELLSLCASPESRTCGSATLRAAAAGPAACPNIVTRSVRSACAADADGCFCSGRRRLRFWAGQNNSDHFFRGLINNRVQQQQIGSDRSSLSLESHWWRRRSRYLPLRKWATASSLILYLYLFFFFFSLFCFYGLALCVLVAMTTESCAWPRVRMKEREREWLASSDVEVVRVCFFLPCRQKTHKCHFVKNLKLWADSVGCLKVSVLKKKKDCFTS